MADDDRRSVGVRVRPNSHDFIRQLRQDLAGKKFTFYVDVHANMTPATRDVRAWAAGPLQKIHASVPVSANTGPASRDLADWRRRQAGIRTEVKVHADTSAAVREIEMVRAAAKDVTIRVKADAQRARSSVERAASGPSGGGRSRASSIDKEFEVGLKKGVEAANARLSEIRSEAKKPIQIGLELDPGFDFKLRRRLADIKAKAKADPVELPIEADIKNLERSIMAAKIVAKSNKLQVPVEYDPTDMKQMRLQLTKLRLLEEAKDIKLHVQVSRSSLERVKDSMEQVGKQFGKFNLIRSLDVGPFNLGKPGGLVGTISTLTLLAGALPGAVAGVTALSDGLIRLSGAAALVPGAIGAIAASLATLTIGTTGIGDAFDSMFAMWDEGASQQGKASAKLVSAQNNYRDAVVDEGRAQERVADARRNALNELRGLNNELRGGVLNEAQALLDLQKAKDRYAQGDFDNNTERLQGQLDIQRAELNVATTREDNLGLQQRANDAQAKGVEGSDGVRDALDAQRRAAEATTAALEALNAGGAGATTATQKFNDQLSQLSPNARDFVETIAGMKDELYGFRNAIQDTIFQGAGPAFRDMFNELLPIIQPGMEQIAQGLNSNLLQVFDTLKSPDGQSIIERILGGSAETQKAISGLINPLITGVGTLVAAGTEKMPQVVELFTRFAERFSIFIEKADKDGSLDKFLDKGIGALADMVEIGLNLIQIVNDLSEAFGGNILTDIKHLTDSWHEFLSSEEGQAKLKAFLQDAKDLWAQWKPVIMELPAAFAAVSDAATNVLGFLLPTIEKILGFLNKFPGAIELIATALITSKLLGSFSTLATTIGGIMGALRNMPGVINKIPGVNLPVPPPAVPGAPPVAGAGGGLAAGGLSTLGATPVAGLAITLPAIIGGLAAGAAGSDLLNKGRDVAIPTGDVGGSGINILPGDADAKKNRVPDGVPKPDSPEAKAAVDAGVTTGDAASKWIAAATDPEDWKKRYLWAVNHPNESKPGSFKQPDSYLTGGYHGYTDWGSRRGRMIEAHGGEYIEPKPTVDHYGLGAMKAVHDKRAVISYDAGGGVPMAYPGNDRVPWGLWPGVGSGLGSYNPNVPGHIPGVQVGKGLGGSQSPFWGKVPTGKNPYPWRDKRRGVEGFEDGGLVWDPNTGQFVQQGAAVSHGAAPNQGPGTGILDLAENLPSGLSRLTATVAPGGDAAVSPFGATGTPPGPGTSPSGGGSFFDSFLSGLGIPGLGGDDSKEDTGPGWGDNGAPMGLGGGDAGPNGEAPFDIRTFGIGPGPAGSGPNDWMQFAGKEIGKFGSSLVTTFFGGLLGSLGISGLSQNITAASPLLNHFFGQQDDSKVQAAGAGDTDAAVTDLLGTEANMADNPAYPGLPTLPNVFDPSTGSAQGGRLQGLQPATAIGEAAIRKNFPWATNIGGVRADSKPWHPNGLALDVMTDPGHGNNDPPSPQGLAKGNALYAWLKQNQAALGIDYLLWGPITGDADHYNHVHVNFAASGPQGGYGGGLGPTLTSPNGAAPNNPPWIPGPVINPKMPQTPPSKKPKGDPKKLFGPSFAGGGIVPLANPNWEMHDPRYPGVQGQYKDSVEAIWGDNEMPIGTFPWQGREGIAPRPPGDPEMPDIGGPVPGFTAPALPPGNPNELIPGPGLGSSLSVWDWVRMQPIKPPPGRKGATMDRGGIIGPGTTMVHNYTGHDELVVPSFLPGGYNTAVMPYKPRPPRPPDAILKRPAPPPTAAPKPQVPAIIAPAPPVVTAPHQGSGAPPGPETPPAPQGPGGSPINLGPVRPATGVGPAEAGDHVHPALAKGITSGFAAAGNIAGAAASMGLGGAGGALGGFVSGLFGQAGKIAKGVANVASSFLVGNITGGTTENPYGVTQRGNVPSGGTRVVDASNNQYGDVYTNNLEEYFRTVDRRNAQKAQSGLGRWGDQV